MMSFKTKWIVLFMQNCSPCLHSPAKAMRYADEALSFQDSVIRVTLISIARIFDWGGGGSNHKSHAMTSSKTSKKEFFEGAKIFWNGRPEAMAWCWHAVTNSF